MAALYTEAASRCNARCGEGRGFNYYDRRGGNRCFEACIPEVMELKHYGDFLNAERDNMIIVDFFGMHVNKESTDLLGDEAKHFKKRCIGEKNN